MMLSQVSEVLSSWPVVVAFGCCWLLTELIFWYVFHWHLVPIANRLRPPPVCRAPYAQNRHLLLQKIVHRTMMMATHHQQEQHSEEQHILRANVTAFLTSWFRPAAATSSSSSSNSSNGDLNKMPGAVKLVSRLSSSMSGSSYTTSSEDAGSVSSAEVESTEESSSWTIEGIHKQDMDDFLAWAMFSKEYSAMETDELEQLAKCYQDIEEKVNLKFEDCHQGSSTNGCCCCDRRRLEPRRMSLETVDPLHRPLAVYVIVMVCQWVVAGIILRMAGFQRVVSPSTGLTGWYRRCGTTAGNMSSPLLFFHGIAPAGLFFYIPMILFGLLKNDDRPCFLFDNRNISCCIDFRAFTEEETVIGVQEIVEQHLPDDDDVDQCSNHLTVCGHSFGSCQLTWLLLSSFGSRRIRQYVLIDPVTVLLSDPDVMNNFLYCKEVSKIRMIASSELFTEYYLRRHFCWYNSELWLDELLSSSNNETRAVIALSEADAIVNAPKVKRHIDRTIVLAREEQQYGRRLKCLYWKNAEHASCVMDPRKWRQVRAQMLQNELEILQQQQQQKQR